ncbi:MAG: hypothetical protein U9N32_06635 [Spirochaetota bacterium]|nr:hypothetical protein [Spirochaetota bacterium]
MNKITFIIIGFLLVSVFTIHADSSLRVGKTAVSAHLIVGKNTEDSIGQLGVGFEYGIMNHLSAGMGYVYVDGRHPLQAHGPDLYVKGFAFDGIMDLYGFDLYGKAGTQIYYQDELGLAYTFLTGVEWQSPFKLIIAVEGGAELENGDWGISIWRSSGASILS